MDELDDQPYTSEDIDAIELFVKKVNAAYEDLREALDFD